MLCPYVQGTQIGLLLPDSTWSSVFTHRAPRPCCVPDDRVHPTDITAAGYTHLILGDAAAQCLHAARHPVARGGNALKRTSKDVHPALESRAADVFCP